MRPLASSAARAVASLAVLSVLVPAALAHGEEHSGHGGMGGMSMGEADQPKPEDQYPPTYFALAEHRGEILAHIALMTLAWVFMLPAAVMLSLARSRYALMLQLAFLAFNTGGVLVGIIYNANTPDLYPNNAHHKIGWIASWVIASQVVVGLLARVAGKLKRSGSGSSASSSQYVPVSTEAMAEHESRFPNKPYRFSHDSGQGTEPISESLRSGSVSSSGTRSPPAVPMRDMARKEEDYVDEDEDVEAAPLTGLPKVLRSHSLLTKVAGKISSRFWRVLVFAYNFVDRTILILGFIAFCTGIIAYGRFFEGSGIFTGLAHWIKGGIFFWLGILTLGRWSGSFGDLGWAWNIRPKTQGQKWCPSAEFAESALIFFYGSTNIFLEHLGGWGGAWSAQDLEHVSITVLFIGGGLCGMLIESTRIRNLLNQTVRETADHPEDAEEAGYTGEPETYSFSMNPIPALVILLLGIMMSSHTQESMTSSMVHKQWGNLLTGASFTRALTYVIMWLRPPRSVYPSRPPTELLTAFALISGGVMFMASSGDTVEGMVHYGLDAMVIYTVTLGMVGLLMAWVISLISLKGWAARKEARAVRR